jgi:hypothetical protein
LHQSTDETTDLDTYGRSSNPTWRHLESALVELEGATSRAKVNRALPQRDWRSRSLTTSSPFMTQTRRQSRRFCRG